MPAGCNGDEDRMEIHTPKGYRAPLALFPDIPDHWPRACYPRPCLAAHSARSARWATLQLTEVAPTGIPAVSGVSAARRRTITKRRSTQALAFPVAIMAVTLPGGRNADRHPPP